MTETTSYDDPEVVEADLKNVQTGLNELRASLATPGYAAAIRVTWLLEDALGVQLTALSVRHSTVNQRPPMLPLELAMQLILEIRQMARFVSDAVGLPGDEQAIADLSGVRLLDPLWDDVIESFLAVNQRYIRSLAVMLHPWLQVNVPVSEHSIPPADPDTQDVEPYWPQSDSDGDCPEDCS